ncbi:MAG: hypothetical protein JWM81_265 [Candidatus Saccharibacteria bacterium]|nr:hypothetical protein [Candidatus Saccharibacteria bacterium]
MGVEANTSYDILRTDASYNRLMRHHDRPEGDIVQPDDPRNMAAWQRVEDVRFANAERFIVALPTAARIGCFVLPDLVTFNDGVISLSGRYYQGDEGEMAVPGAPADDLGWVPGAQIDFDFNTQTGNIKFLETAEGSTLATTGV